jgi:hypothetical protein
MSADTSTDLTFTGTTTGSLVTSTWPFTTGTQVAPRKDGWKAEWKKFREEFIRKLLVDDPEGIFEFEMKRSMENYRDIRVELKIKYEPDFKKEGKARR